MDALVSGLSRDAHLERLPSTFRFADVREAGIAESRLRRWLAQGLVVRLAHGLYRRSDAALVDLDRLEIAVRVPRGTVCLVSGLAEHDLVDDNPSLIDVAIPRGDGVRR